MAVRVTIEAARAAGRERGAMVGDMMLTLAHVWTLDGRLEWLQCQGHIRGVVRGSMFPDPLYGVLVGLREWPERTGIWGDKWNK